MTRTGAAAPEQVQAGQVSASFFSVLGVQPELGRGFRPEEDRPGNNHVVILSHNLWRKWFAASRSAIGADVALDGDDYTVVGIMPLGFSFKDMRDAKLWAPLVLSPGVQRPRHWLRVIGRLSPGGSLKQAQVEMDLIAQVRSKRISARRRRSGHVGAPVASQHCRILRSGALSIWIFVIQSQKCLHNLTPGAINTLVLAQLRWPVFSR